MTKLQEIRKKSDKMLNIQKLKKEQDMKVAQ